jgi:hypothetical protein
MNFAIRTVNRHHEPIGDTKISRLIQHPAHDWTVHRARPEKIAPENRQVTRLGFAHEGINRNIVAISVVKHRKRAFFPTYRQGSGDGVMPAHER